MHFVNYAQEFTYLYFDKCQMTASILDVKPIILIKIDIVRIFVHVFIIMLIKNHSITLSFGSEFLQKKVDRLN